MLSFSGVTFILVLLRLVCVFGFYFYFYFYLFYQSCGPSFNHRFSICMRPGGHTQLRNNRPGPIFSSFFFLEGVAFSEHSV